MLPILYLSLFFCANFIIGYQDQFKDVHLCTHGRNQSPINLSHYQANATPLEQREFHFEYKNWENLQLELEKNPLNKFDKPDDMQLASKLRIYNKKSDICPYVEYNALQFHFHTPSEHSINDNDPERNPTLHPDIQMHVVHQISEQFADKCLDGALYLEFFSVGCDVLRVMHKNKIVYTGDDFFLKLNYKANMDKYQQGGKAIFGQYLKLWFAAQGAYHYRGSLTTPGCDEAVDWYIAKEVQMVRKQTLGAVKEMLENPSNREKQALNDRIVYKIDKSAFKDYKENQTDL